MRVAGNGKVYAAPWLVHHYVVAHNYRPPDEFIAAVLAWDETLLSILWVENHPQFARLAVRQFLGKHTVSIVPSITAALRAIEDHWFDVMLVDFDLDDGKGDELVRLLVSWPRRPRIVATSSHEAGNNALVRAGADAVCGKLEFARIAEVIDRLIAKG
jgi:CheY-like chemotaxis protein